MNYDEYQRSLRMLSGVYKHFDETYGEERTKILWNFVKKIPVRDFNNAISSVIGCKKMVPLPDEMYLACKVYIDAAREAERKTLVDAARNQRFCTRCSNTGVMNAKKPVQWDFMDKASCNAEVSARLSCLAFRCVHCTAFTTLRLSSVKYPDWNPKEHPGYDLWLYEMDDGKPPPLWKIKKLKKMLKNLGLSDLSQIQVEM